MYRRVVLSHSIPRSDFPSDEYLYFFFLLDSFELP